MTRSANAALTLFVGLALTAFLAACSVNGSANGAAAPPAPASQHRGFPAPVPVPSSPIALTEMSRMKTGHFNAARAVPGHPNMLQLRDGEMLRKPPMERVRCGWKGNQPPHCSGETGFFFREYSGAAQDFAREQVLLPEPSPIQSPSPYGDTGYIYLEGWPGVGANTSEVGLQYDEAKQDYIPYYNVGSGYNYGDIFFPPGDLVNMWLAPYTCGQSGPCFDFVMWDAQQYYRGAPSDVGWSELCCVFAAVTTIGQTQGYNSDSDGSIFGPATYTWNCHQLYGDDCNADVGKYEGGDGHSCSFNGECYTHWTDGGGEQRYPRNDTRIIKVGGHPPRHQIVEIDLHP